MAPLVLPTLAFMLGLLCRGAPLHLAGGVLLFFALADRIIRGGRRRSADAALLALWLALGLLRVAVWEGHPAQRLADHVPEIPAPVRIHGFISDDLTEPFAPDESGPVTCLLEVRHVRVDSRWHPLDGRVRATIHAPRLPLAFGDEVIAQGVWRRVPAPGNPGQYDRRAALARNRIHGLLTIRPQDGVAVIGSSRDRAPWLAGPLWLRQRWGHLLDEGFSRHDAGVLRSALLGQRVALDERLKEAFVETGTVHLLVISGFNVGLVALLLEGVLRLLGMPWRLRPAILAVALGGYAVLTGLQPPVIRATLMAWVVLGALVLDRLTSWPNTIAAAALLILLLDPAQLLDPGFQLSFGAVISLLVFVTRWQPVWEARVTWIRPAWLRRGFTASCAATVAVWIGLWPLLAWYFHLVAPVSVLANLLLGPLISVLVSFGTTALALGTFLPGMLACFAPLLTALVRALSLIALMCHAMPFGCLPVGHPPLPLIAGYYALLALTLRRVQLRLSPARLLLCGLAALSVWVWAAAALRADSARWLQIDVLDVGHGDSILVRTPQGHRMLIDAGDQEAGAFRVVPSLQYLGLASLDALILTHPDADHLGGALPLLQAVRVRHLLTNGARGDTMAARRVAALASAQQIPSTSLAAGLRIAGDPRVQIEVLHPPRGGVPGVEPSSNDNSLVLRLTMGAVSVLLTGDIEEAGLPWLLAQAAVPRVTVLKVPHHGSRLGTPGARLLQATRPSVAVISVGRKHHLPAKETVQELARAGAAVYTTRDDGAISLRTDGERLRIRTFRGGMIRDIMVSDDVASTDR